MNKIFDINNIVLLKLDEEDLMSFLLKMDIDDLGQPLYPLELFTEELISVIPEYVFADYENPSIPRNQIISKIRESAKSIYRIKEYDLMRKAYLNDDKEAQTELESLPYNKRGEFGELLLHFLLRDFKGTIPLVSKIYFKDSSGIPAHGFDAVHISPNEKILWLGESKLYTDSKQGILALIDDLNKHMKTDYLNDQFVLIKKNLYNNSIPQRDEWIKILTQSRQLIEKIRMVNIPLLCTYENDIYAQIKADPSLDFDKTHELNVRDLKKYFDDKNTFPLKTQCNIILLLLPIESKKDLVRRLHERLWHMQSM
ncbi:MAG: DUF1837 domain-containing protein [Christensenellales bacterium]